jgi:hypothetical protein
MVIPRTRTNIHLLVFHLTVADSIVSFLIMPMEAIWRYTMQVTISITLIHDLSLILEQSLGRIYGLEIKIKIYFRTPSQTLSI